MQVVLIDSDSKTILYQTHIASELCAGVISMQFNTCSLHGFDKNILVVATKDSSVLALETETGNILSPSSVHPKKPSRALFMQNLGISSLCIESVRFLGKASHECLKLTKNHVFSFSLHLVQTNKNCLVED